MSLLSSSDADGGPSQLTRLSAAPFPTSLAAFKRTSADPSATHAEADGHRLPPTASSRKLKEGRSAIPSAPQNASHRQRGRGSFSHGTSGMATHRRPNSVFAQSADAAATTGTYPSSKLPNLRSSATRTVPQPPPAATSSSSAASSGPAAAGATPSSRSRSSSKAKTKSKSSTPNPSARHSKKTSASSRSGRAASQRSGNTSLATSARSHGTAIPSTTTEPHPSYQARPPEPRRPNPSTSYLRRTGLSADVAAFKIQRAVRQWILFPESRLIVDGLAARVRERITVEARLEAIRVRAAKRTLAVFFSGLCDVNALRVEQLRREIDTKAATVVCAFLRARNAQVLRAVRWRNVAQVAVRRIERAWCRSPLYATVTTLSQDAHAQRLLMRHETVERREMMRRRLAHMILLHQQAYNDPRMIEAGLATRHVPITASSILLGSTEEGATQEGLLEQGDVDGARLAILLGHSFRDDLARTLRLFERCTFFSAHEAQLLIEEGILEVAPSTYEKPPKCADIFNFETFIHEQFQVMLRQQEAARATREDECAGCESTQVCALATASSCAYDGLTLDADDDDVTALGAKPKPSTEATSSTHTTDVYSLRHDTVALAARAQNDGLVNWAQLAGSRSTAYQCVVAGAAPAAATTATLSLPSTDATFDDVRAAANGMQHIALAPPTQNALLVHPRFHSSPLFTALARDSQRPSNHSMGTACCDPQQQQQQRQAEEEASVDGASTLRLGPLCDATTARFLSPRRAAVPQPQQPPPPPQAAAEVTPFLMSEHALGSEWSQWLLLSNQTDQTTRSQPHRNANSHSNPTVMGTASVSLSCAVRERCQCILPLPLTSPFLLDDFLPSAKTTTGDVNATAQKATHSLIITKDHSVGGAWLYNVERLLIQEHRHRAWLHESWMAQWKSVSALATIQQARYAHVN